MNALERLLTKGEVQLDGHILGRLYDDLHDNVLMKHDDIWGIIGFEASKKNGFVSDSTNIYIVRKNATFRPAFTDGRDFIMTRNNNKEDFYAICKLHPLGVAPMRQSEVNELKKILAA